MCTGWRRRRAVPPCAGQSATGTARALRRSACLLADDAMFPPLVAAPHTMCRLPVRPCDPMIQHSARDQGPYVRGWDRGRRPGQAVGTEAKRLRPSASERYLVIRWPRTLLPAASSGGENVPTLPLPGDTVTMPPLTPLLPGRATSYSH